MIKVTGGRLELKSKEKIMREKGIVKGGKIQKYIDSEVLRRCAGYIPLDSGDLKKSGTDKTKIGDGQVKYDTVYARRWYFMPANFKGAPKRGRFWFERMKNNGGKSAIFRGVQVMLKRGDK